MKTISYDTFRSTIKKIVTESIKNIIKEGISPIVWHFCPINSMYYIEGKESAKETINYGEEILNNQFIITETGDYTVAIGDEAGNTAKQEFYWKNTSKYAIDVIQNVGGKITPENSGDIPYRGSQSFNIVANTEEGYDLIGLKGVVRQEEMIYPLVYNQLPQGVQIKQVAGSKTAFQMLMRGDVDYMLTSLYYAEAEVRRFKLIDKVHFPSVALLKPSLFFAFSSVSECHLLQPKFSEALKAMKKDSVAYRKYFVSYIDQWGIDFKDEPQLEW